MDISFESDLNIIKLDGVMVSLQCHHYNCGLVKVLEEMEEVNARDIFIQAATEEFYKNFNNFISSHLEGKTGSEKKEAAADLYRFMGFGRLDLSRLNESGGIVYADSSYYVTGWLAKYGRRTTPLCHLTCGFISGIMSAIYGKTPGEYSVEEKKCIITGNDMCKFVVSLVK
jgi:predicted hydrocarbon binding protein